MNFSFTSKEEVLVIGGEMTMPKKDGVLLLFYVSIALFLLMLLFSFFFTSSLLDERRANLKVLSAARSTRELEEKNVNVLRSLSGSINTLSKDQALVESAIPDTARPEEMVSLIEQIFQELQRTYRVILPEVISWIEVPETDITADEYAELGITEVRFSYYGDYHGFIELLNKIRSSRRLLDVRSVRGFSFLPKESAVKADLSLWAYHL